MKTLTFDLEIRKLIPNRREQVNPRFEYCGGWNDKPGMGISFGCAYLDWLDEFRLYGEENIMELVSDMGGADVVTGYNIISFDMPLLFQTVLRVTGTDQSKIFKDIHERIYDPFADIKQAIGNDYPKGWTLDNVAGSVLTFKKNGDGAEAPKLWQRGELAKLATYVIQDVKVEKELFKYVLANESLPNIQNGEMVQLPGIKELKKKFKIETLAA